MTTPNLTPEPSEGVKTDEYGPDYKASLREPPKESQKKPPRPALGNLGMNKKLRSPVRKLTDDDRDKIASLYTFAAMGVMPFRVRTAQAMAEAADSCADAWLELAEKNDSVRRALLAIIEGGVWGKVFAVHLPILFTIMPDNAMSGMWKLMQDKGNEFMGDSEEG